MNMPMTIYLAWAVRTALLVLYIPVQLMSFIVQRTYQLDLWACAVVMQSASQSADLQSTQYFRGSANPLCDRNSGAFLHSASR